MKTDLVSVTKLAKEGRTKPTEEAGKPKAHTESPVQIPKDVTVVLLPGYQFLRGVLSRMMEVVISLVFQPAVFKEKTAYPYDVLQ